MNTLDTPNIPNPASVSYSSRALRFGLIGGLISLGFCFISNLTGLAQPGNTGSGLLMMVVSLAISFGIAYMATKSHRDEDLGGYITLGRGLAIGFVALMIATILGAIFNYIYLSFIDPGMMERAFEQMREQFEERGMSEEQIDAALSMSQKFTSPLMTSIFALGGGAFFSLIISLVAGAILKKDPPMGV